MPPPPRILAIDDSPTNLLILEEILGEPYRLVCARSGAEGITFARTLRPDLVMLDVMMPGLDGYEVCRELRADPACRAKLLIVSAKALGSEREAGFAAGADDYLTKPFEESALLAKVEALLGDAPAPRPRRAPPPSSTRLARIEARPATRGALLIVDDDSLVREVTAEMASAMGFAPLVAPDGVRALELLRERDDVRCALLDWRMAPLRGLAVLALLRSERPGLPAVFCTGCCSEEVEAARAAGMTRELVLRKPYPLAELERALETALAGASAAGVSA